MRQLNDEQQRAYDLIMQFIDGRTENQMFCLKGYAGTGKTFLISRVIEEVERRHRGWKIAMTAPTNKAVQVLRESASVSKRVAFKTIHSLLGLKEEIKDSGEIEFSKDWNAEGETFSNVNLLIIDEVSMLADQLFYEVKRYNNDVKIIMMGDPAQIPPVGKEDCEPFLNPEQHGIIEFQLTKIMRQSDGSAIIDNSMRIRTELDNEDIEWTPGSDLSILSSERHRELLSVLFDRKFRNCEDLDQIKVIAWANRKVDEYNRYIRKIMYGYDAPVNSHTRQPLIPRFVEGERLVMNKPFFANSHQKNKDDWDMLSTNQEVTIISFDEVLDAFDLPDKRYLAVKVYYATVEYINKLGSKKRGVIRIMHEESEKNFQHELNAIKTKAITGPMTERRNTWKQYYKLLRQVADVSYAYAITAHKSQGSTYKTTIVDAKNIMMNANTVERNRILYTAITRAKSELFIIK